MSIREEGNNIIVDGSIAGSLFPKNERDIIFPVLIDGTATQQALHIEGSVYGRSIEMRGGVTIDGPIVSRGDAKLAPSDKKIRLNGGITVNGILNCISSFGNDEFSLTDDVRNASTIIRGDVAVNQNLFLSNVIVFGSIRAINCKLQNCIVLGTLMIQEKLTVSMSSVGGYSAREVTFEGSCMLIHALGESLTRPLFGPFETFSGDVIVCDVRYYPAVRESSGIVNLSHVNHGYPSYSRLDPFSDWVQVDARANVVERNHEESVSKSVLSIGGRIGDFTQIKESIDALTNMLKCGFEYDHLTSHIQHKVKNSALANLNDDENWILNQVCM